MHMRNTFSEYGGSVFFKNKILILVLETIRLK